MNELKDLWLEIHQRYGSTSEFIDSKPNLIVVVPRHVKLLFWKIKERFDRILSIDVTT